MSLVTSPIVITVPTRGLLAVETMHAIVQWLENLNRRNMMSMFVNKKNCYVKYNYILLLFLLLLCCTSTCVQFSLVTLNLLKFQVNDKYFSLASLICFTKRMMFEFVYTGTHDVRLEG